MKKIQHEIVNENYYTFAMKAVACLRLRTYLHLNGCFFIGDKL